MPYICINMKFGVSELQLVKLFMASFRDGFKSSCIFIFSFCLIIICVSLMAAAISSCEARFHLQRPVLHVRSTYGSEEDNQMHSMVMIDLHLYKKVVGNSQQKMVHGKRPIPASGPSHRSHKALTFSRHLLHHDHPYTTSQSFPF